MPDKSYHEIVDAIDLLATGTPKKTNGKITVVNVAAEAGLSKASVYRYFKEHKELEEAYIALRKNGIRRGEAIAPETVEEAYLLLRDEVKHLRSELAEVKRQADQTNKLKSHQILVLWTENERLHKLLRNPRE